MSGKTQGAVINLRIPGQLLSKLDERSGSRQAFITSVLSDALIPTISKADHLSLERKTALALAAREAAEELRTRPGGDDPERDLKLAQLLMDLYAFFKPVNV